MLKEIDKTVTNYLNTCCSNPLLDQASHAINTGLWLLIPALLILLLVLKRKKEFALASTSSVIAFALTQALKQLMKRPRPEHLIKLFNLATYSMPSGHTSTAFAIATIASNQKKKHSPFYITAAITIALSRIYAGVHYFSDVIAGALLGIIVGEIVTLKKETIFKFTKLKIHKEIKRKIFHITMGFLFILLIKYAGKTTTSYLTTIIIITGILVRGILFKGGRVPIIEIFLNAMERKKERKKNPGIGALYFLISITFLTALFQENTCIIAILILSISDALASTVGKFFGTTPLAQGKTLEGSLAFYISSLIISFQFLDPIQAILVALLATTLEFSNIINDNLSVPIGVALLISAF